DQVSHSRHCILFEQLRYFAYSIVNRERELGSFESFMRSLDAYAYNHNSFLKQGFSENLPLSSIRATVKSVGRWTWDRYTGDR
ncbi:primase C-terminal domain-containing protein, partial [Pseudomonas savastanoi]